MVTMGGQGVKPSPLLMNNILYMCIVDVKPLHTHDTIPELLAVVGNCLLKVNLTFSSFVYGRYQVTIPLVKLLNNILFINDLFSLTNQL